MLTRTLGVNPVELQPRSGEPMLQLALLALASGRDDDALHQFSTAVDREPGLAEFVADIREAHRRHGGSGALYVYLRKGEQR